MNPQMPQAPQMGQPMHQKPGQSQQNQGTPEEMMLIALLEQQEKDIQELKGQMQQVMSHLQGAAPKPQPVINQPTGYGQR